MTVIRASIFVIILVGIFIGYRVWQSPEVEMESAPAIQNVPPVVVPNGTVDVEVETILPTGNIPITSLDQPGCLTERQFKELPELMQEAERMEAISASGTALTAYENLGEDSLQSFANQEQRTQEIGALFDRFDEVDSGGAFSREEMNVR